jgi:hypothetical protein
MDWLQYGYYVFAFLYVMVLPAYVVGRLLYPRERVAVRMGLGMVLNMTVVPMLAFGVAMVFATNLTEPLLFGAASAVIVAALVVQAVRTRRRTGKLED